MTTYSHYRSASVLEEVARHMPRTSRHADSRHPRDIAAQSAIGQVSGFRKRKSKISLVRAKTIQGSLEAKNAARSAFTLGRNWYVTPHVTAINFQSPWPKQDANSLACRASSFALPYAAHELPDVGALVNQFFQLVREAVLRYELTAPSVAPAPAPDPLAAARSRGESYMRSQIDHIDNLNLDGAASYSGMSGRHINELRQRGELYALVLQGNTRGFRYPKWQFDAPRERRAPVVQKMYGMGLGCWAVHDFMMRPNEHLGRSPSDALLDPDFLLKRIEDAVDVRFGGGDQGAS